jgi:hypothetical protein
MNAGSHHKTPAVLRITIALGILAGWLFCGNTTFADTPQMKWRETGKLMDHRRSLNCRSSFGRWMDVKRLTP